MTPQSFTDGVSAHSKGAHGANTTMNGVGNDSSHSSEGQNGISNGHADTNGNLNGSLNGDPYPNSSPNGSSPASSVPHLSPIAIVGMSCKFAGDATNASKFWDLCVSGKDSWAPIPSHRFNAEALYHPDGLRTGRVGFPPSYFWAALAMRNSLIREISSTMLRVDISCKRILVYSMRRSLTFPEMLRAWVMVLMHAERGGLIRYRSWILN